MTSTKIRATLIVAASLAATFSPLYARENHPAAPMISVVDISGHRHDLTTYRGKVVVLNFWVTWCEPCRAEIPDLIELQKRYLDRRLAVLGIAVQDDLPSVQNASKQLNINYPVALGDRKLSAVFGGVGFPTTFVIGRDGRVYSKHLGATNLRVLEDEVAQLLETSEASEVANFRPAGKAEPVELPTPEELNSEVPGIDISRLTAAQLADFKIVLEREQCNCGCHRALLQCLKEDGACESARKMGREELTKFLKTDSFQSQSQSQSQIH
jgi:thiol-disulfide isomerase/thioredoxin